MPRQTFVAAVLCSLAASRLVQVVQADLPIHCLAEDAEGDWQFALGPSSRQRNSCGHSRPDDSQHEPLLQGWPPRGANELITVSLLPGGGAKLADQEGGSWRLVSDEALHVRGGRHDFLAFFGYRPLPADDAGEHLPLAVQRAHSRCNETVLGWYQVGDREAWGCWYGRRVDGPSPGGGSFLQRRSSARRGRVAAAAATAAAEVRAVRRLGLLRTLGGAAAVPALDWRNVSGRSWVDLPAKQGHCGSCYAVAATQMLAARHRVARGDAGLEGFAADFPLRCGEFTQGCRGGYPYLVAKWSEDVGLLPASCAATPQLSEDADAEGRCQIACPDAALSRAGRWRAANYRYVQGGEDAMIDELASGPLAVSFHSDPELLQYSGGVWEPSPMEEDGSSDDVGGGAGERFVPPTHSALLVGYGEDAAAGPYWIVQNQWGGLWGEAGSFRIRRDLARQRGFESLVVAADVVAEDRPELAAGFVGAPPRSDDASAAEHYDAEVGAALLELRRSVATARAGAGAGTGGHRGEVICVEPPAAEDDQSIVVRLDPSSNFRSLSFGGSAGTETAVRCSAAAAASCAVAPSVEAAPACSEVAGCACDLKGQGLPYPGMQAIGEKVALMCTASADPLRVLLIGLGGGAISSYLQDRCGGPGRLALENIEKDGRVAELAAKFFGFRADEGNSVEVADGGSAVAERPRGSYDAIIVDCFAGHDRVPEGCRSPQFVASARALLKSDGIMLQNAWGRSAASDQVPGDFEALVAAYMSTFTGGPGHVRKEVVYSAPQSLEYIVYGLKGDRWASLLPEDAGDGA